MKQQAQMVDAQHILEQAKRIRDIAQSVIDACESETVIEPYARNKVMGGSLAQDAATLGIMIAQYENEAQ